ncbi:MAG: YebC/PmpR family DNA-binding transcriptional regulator [Tenericutes bacterium]|nr:MAG: YebC/PmpR family DNA-binding transcriptional regulator [Mycoplasmatota bacterium]
MHKKGAKDKKRQKDFQKVSREISVAAKEGGNDPDTNPRLRLAIQKAKSINMPKENVTNLLKKSDKALDNVTEILYEGYGPNGVAILIEVLTDNINRSAGEVKSTLTKRGGNLGSQGSVSYLFETKGIIVFQDSYMNMEDAFELLMDFEVLDIKEDDGLIIVETTPTGIVKISEELTKNNVEEFITNEVSKVAISTVELDEKASNKLENLIEALEDLGDVLDVHTNAN